MANIKIQDVAQRIQYTATASQTEFAIPFPFFESSDIVFYQGETLLVQGTGTDEYAVAGANTASGGTATLVTGATTGDIITISGATPIDRTSIYSATISNLTGSDLNNDFNRDIVISKQIETTQELLQVQYAPYTEVSQDPTVTVDRWLPKLGANQVWAMNAGVTEIVPYDLSATGGLVNTVVGTDNQIDVDSTDGTNPVLSLSSTLIAPGTIQSGNIKVNGNTITSEDTNGNMNLTPNGTGDLVLDGLKWPQADGTANQVIETDGAGQLAFSTITGQTAATQSDMETATSTTVFSAPGVQEFHPGHPKGWVIYNQVTPGIGASYNVTSVTDSATGVFIVNWTTDFSSIEYSAIATTQGAGGGNNLVGVGQVGAKTVGATTFGCIQLTAQIDRVYNNVIACGDQ